MKGTSKQPDEEVHRVLSRKEYQSPLNWSSPPSQHFDVFTNSEAHQIHFFKIFNGHFNTCD